MLTSSTESVRSFALAIAVTLGFAGSARAASLVTITPQKDSTTVLHNPMMGLTSYSGDFAGDYRVLPYTNIVYIRRTWTTFEPTEGNYVWVNDPGWKSLFKAAKDRGFRLAFRVMVQEDWGSPQKHGTPQYVWDAIRAAGQDSVMHGGNPDGVYIDVTNAIWQQKFKTFILAMGKEFDDPSITDYIDVSALGPSAEGNPWQEGFADVDHDQSAYMDWHVGVYDQAFKKVVLNYNMPWNPDISLKYGLSFRRDGLGSGWVDSAQIKTMQQRNLSATALLGEYCYSFNGVPDSAIGWAIDSAIIQFALPGKPTLATAIDLALSQGFAMHANTLNLSDFDWFPRLPDRLARLIANLGYRLRPQTVQYPPSVASDSPFLIHQTWVNDGVGALPNNNIRWNQKYAVAYALFSGSNTTPTQVKILNWTNPGEFVNGKPSQIDSWINWVAAPGTYTLAVGIVDKTRPNDSSLALAIANPIKRNGWYLLGDIQITDAVPTRSAFDRIEAEAYNGSSVNCIWPCSEGGQNLGCIASGNYAFYKNIDFGSGAQSFLARMGSPGGTGKIILHLDSLKAPVAGILTNPIKTSDWQVFATNATSIPTITGIHDLYLEFEAGFDINWFSFSQNLTTSAFSRIEAEDYTSSSVNCTWACSEGGQNLGCIASGNYAFYKNIDFGSGAQSFLARLGSPGGTGKITLHLDSLKAPPAGVLANPTRTTDWEDFATNTTEIPMITGIHDLYLEFEAGFDFNWFSFGKEAAAIRDLPKAGQNSASLHKGQLKLSLAWSGTTQVRMTTLSGKTVLAKTISGQDSNITMGDLPAGIYLLEARSTVGTFAQRLVKN